METGFEYVPLAALSVLGDHRSENNLSRRQLYLSQKKYAAAIEGLETAKEYLHYHKTPFSFLDLPREVRDEIYLYALQAPVEARPYSVQTLLTMEGLISIDSLISTDLFKLPTPGLCFLNSQVHMEANEIMYSKNTFAFSGPQPMLKFLEKIGEANRNLIRSISIWVNFGLMLPHISKSKSEGVLRWVNALTECDLKRIRSICVEGTTASQREWRCLAMDPALEEAIKDILLRDKEDRTTRQLRLKGFHLDERKRFPENWNVVMELWYPDISKDALRPVGTVSPTLPVITGYYSSAEAPQ